jgi:hypothetical protein
MHLSFTRSHSCYQSSGYTHCPSCNEPITDAATEMEPRFTAAYDVDQHGDAVRGGSRVEEDDDWGYSSGPHDRFSRSREFANEDEGFGASPERPPRGFYPAANAPWLPSNPATGKSAHISMWQQRATPTPTSTPLPQSRPRHERSQQRDRPRSWESENGGRDNERDQSGRDDRHRPRTGRKGHNSQLDKLADMVYDRLMCSNQPADRR